MRPATPSSSRRFSVDVEVLETPLAFLAVDRTVAELGLGRADRLD